MKAVVCNPRESRISIHGDFRERRIAHRVRHSVTKNPVTQLDPGVSREGTSVTPHTDPDAVTRDTMRVEHAAESYSPGQTERLKEAVARCPTDR
jgi:hypothetical protein